MAVVTTTSGQLGCSATQPDRPTQARCSCFTEWGSALRILPCWRGGHSVVLRPQFFQSMSALAGFLRQYPSLAWLRAACISLTLWFPMQVPEINCW